MIDKNLHTFIDGAINFFNHTGSDVAAKVGSPYLIDSTSKINSDYTGCITVSGEYQGFCNFSAPKILLKHLIMSLGETDTSEEMLIDTVGEVANTLSGNARESLGKNFIISVPKVVKGYPDGATSTNQRVYVIPINWHSYKATLSVCLYQ